MKRLIRIVLPVGLLALFSLAAVGGVMWCRSDQTVYANGFSESKFRTIHTGVSEQEVRRLLGAPLLVDDLVRNEMWLFRELELGKGPATFDLLAEANAVCFDANGNVLSVYGDLRDHITPGMTRDDVIRLDGRPDRTVPRISKTLHYTKPGAYGLYRARILDVDEQGTVVRVTAYETYD